MNFCRLRPAETRLVVCLIAVAVITSINVGCGRAPSSLELDTSTLTIEIRPPESFESESIVVYTIYEESLGTTGCSDSDATHTSRIYRCVLTRHADTPIRFVVLKIADGRAVVYDAEIWNDSPDESWTGWQRPSFVETAADAEWHLFRQGTTDTRTNAGPESNFEARFRKMTEISIVEPRGGRR